MVVPNVSILVPFAAERYKSSFLFGTKNFVEYGMTETSAPVSIKKSNLFFLSFRNKRLVHDDTPLLVAATVECFSLFDFH
jgi:hypothetical protein